MSHEAIDPTCSVKDTMAHYPQTRGVFTRFGLDTCCGAVAPIVDAARRDGADLTTLLAALNDALHEAPAAV
jgi:iron-sulfur cluster repair protein YtfE (RIC family)